MSDFEGMLIERLTDKEQVTRSRIHPFTLLVAMRNYQAGKGFRNTWDVNHRIVSALETAFDLSLNAVENTGTRNGLIVDVSSSMQGGNVAGSNISPIEAAGAMAAINARQGDAVVLGVNDRVTKLNISDKSRMSEVVDKMKRLGGYTTNLGLGIEYFLNHKIKLDAIVYYTDNEVNQGKHPIQLFDKYKREVSPNCKLVCVAMTASNFSIADETRNDNLDICGFDTMSPQVIENFTKGF